MYQYTGQTIRPARWMRAVLLVATVSLAGCASLSFSPSKPSSPDQACRIFKEKPSWYKHTYRAAKKWKVHGPLLLAIMKQESSFIANARPKRNRVLGIPLGRPSSAYGYAQAIDGTWRLYQKSAGRWGARRNRFSDAMDFIGWYVAQTRKRLKVSPKNGYANYLAYHEGWTGYAKKTYNRKKWLRSVAKRVNTQAKRYHAQLKRCGIKLP